VASAGGAERRGVDRLVMHYAPVPPSSGCGSLPFPSHPLPKPPIAAFRRWREAGLLPGRGMTTPCPDGRAMAWTPNPAHAAEDSGVSPYAR